jgi:hypothetical protein
VPQLVRGHVPDAGGAGDVRDGVLDARLADPPTRDHPHIQHEQVETTAMYLHADLAIKERALARTKPLDSKPGRYRPPDALLGFLDGL